MLMIPSFAPPIEKGPYTSYAIAPLPDTDKCLVYQRDMGYSAVHLIHGSPKAIEEAIRNTDDEDVWNAISLNHEVYSVSCDGDSCEVEAFRKLGLRDWVIKEFDL
jgi:hypothetical protein